MKQQLDKCVNYIKQNWMIYVGIAVILIALSYNASIQIRNHKQQSIYDSLITIDTTNPENEKEEIIEEAPETKIEEIKHVVKDNGLIIDFDALWELNEDVYAWISLPEAGINYPILQNPTSYDYYLDHNIDDSNGKPGCIYTNIPQAKDMTDFVTILYGHNMNNGTMFGGLRSFYDKDFFDQNEYIYVYTPTKKFTYQILKTTRHDDSYLPTEYDNFSEEGIYDFIEMLCQNETENITHDRIMSFGITDRYLILSTCIRYTNDRYLVIGKLVEETE